MLNIGIFDANDSITEVDLEDRTYFLRTSWNSVAGQWVLSIENGNNELIIAGIAIVPDYPLLAPYRHLPLPPGELVAVVPDRRNSIDRDALPSGDVALIYISSEE